MSTEAMAPWESYGEFPASRPSPYRLPPDFSDNIAVDVATDSLGRPVPA